MLETAVGTAVNIAKGIQTVANTGVIIVKGGVAVAKTTAKVVKGTADIVTGTAKIGTALVKGGIEMAGAVGEGFGEFLDVIGCVTGLKNHALAKGILHASNHLAHAFPV